MTPGPVSTDRRPLVLVWEVTQACALACKHCRADAQPDRHPDELTTAEGRGLLEDARRFGPGQLVVLSGGDPLARDDVVDLVGYGSDLGLRMTLTPSGTASLTADRVGELSEAGLRRMALSFDGTRDDHDEFRGEPGSFDSTLEAAEAARAVGLPLQVNTTVCAETVDGLGAVRDLTESLGAVLWSVFFLVPVGRGRTLDPIPPDRAERVMEWLVDVDESASFRVKTTEAPHFRRVAQQAGGGGRRGLEERPRGINAGDGFAFVSHRGEVYPSGFLPLPAGSVREGGIVECYRDSPLFTALRDRDNLTGKCGACPFRRVCGGSRSRAFATAGDPFASDPLCAYLPPGYDGPRPSPAVGGDR